MSNAETIPFTPNLDTVRFILGATNTGKTHYAIERMLAHASGMIGLPLRLLAREVYDRVVEEKGSRAVALITGEERIYPDEARYFICTTEAMPVSIEVDCLCVDEIQLANDPERGHIFTDRLINARGRSETLFIGAETIRPVLHSLGFGPFEEPRRRFSTLSHIGHVKLTKLPKRTAIVAFSADEVYAIAELLKRQKGGAAIVMGALSPRTRNAQAELYQSGEVDYLVATDAIGMGLNLDIDHIAFAAKEKFDGQKRRPLRADELAQIAGRAGRHTRDGSFGETSSCAAIENNAIERIEESRFTPLARLFWRNSKLDFTNIETLQASLNMMAPSPFFIKMSHGLDAVILQQLKENMAERLSGLEPKQVSRLWELCCIPDFRGLGAEAHTSFVSGLIEPLIISSGHISDSWFNSQVERLDSLGGDIETLQDRLAEIRIFSYIAYRNDWLQDPEKWQALTRTVEDKLSDALHEALMQRFIDKRTSMLLNKLNDNEELIADLDENGDVTIEGAFVGHLRGLNFVPDSRAKTLEARASRRAAEKALGPVLEKKLQQITDAPNDALRLSLDGKLLYNNEAIAELKKGADWLSPDIIFIGKPPDSQSYKTALERLYSWLNHKMTTDLETLTKLKSKLDAGEITGLARGIAFQMIENCGVLDRRSHDFAWELTGEDKKQLQQSGIWMGRFSFYLRGGLKLLPLRLVAILLHIYEDCPPLSWDGELSRTTFPVERGINQRLLFKTGFIKLGPYAVRLDSVERFWQNIMETYDKAQNGYAIKPDLFSTLGAKREEGFQVLKDLGFTPSKKNDSGTPSTWRLRKKRYNNRPDASRATIKQAETKPGRPGEANASGRSAKKQIAAQPKKKQAHKKLRHHDKPRQANSPSPFDVLAKLKD